MARKFAKVRVKPGVFRLIQVGKESGGFVTGTRVTKSGEPWERRLPSGDVQRETVVAKASDVVDRLAMNLRYAELESVGGSWRNQPRVPKGRRTGGRWTR